MMDAKKLANLVNQSGFALQIGLERYVNETRPDHGWKVLRSEHSWVNGADKDGGFIDLVLENEKGDTVLVVECKRVLDSTWIFLNPNRDVKRRRHAKSWVTRYAAPTFRRFGWFDVTLEPSSPESPYCIVPGQDAKSKPMLERVASELILATAGLAEEEKPYEEGKYDAVRFYFSVIVTTAKLMIGSFDPRKISLADGMVTDPSFQELPFIRFRKQLSFHPAGELPPVEDGAHSLARAKEHTVFIVNAERIGEFLGNFEVDESLPGLK